MTHEQEDWVPSEQDWFPEMTPEQQRQFEATTETLNMLADQVGVRCCQCGTVIHSRDGIGMVSHMAPLGTQDFRSRPYCVPCAEVMHEDV